MKWNKAILAVLLFPFSTAAQTGADLSGYVMDVPLVQSFHGKIAQLNNADPTQYLNVTRLRLRPSLTFSDETQLAMEYEAVSVFNSSSSLHSLSDYDARRQLVKLRWTPFSGENGSMMHFVDRLYLRHRFDDADIIIGRQRISWGTGRVWNPTDLFNPLNPTSYAKIEKDGVDAATAKMHFGNFTDLTLVYNPQKDWNGYNTGFRFRSNIHEFDLSMMGGYFDRRAVIGGDFAGNFFDAGIRGEGILSAESGNLSSSFIKYILGADYQFTSALYGMFEYHFNGEGAKNTLQYDFGRLAKGEIVNVGRNYVVLHASYLLHPLVTASAAGSANVDDRSQFWNLTVTYSASNELAIALGGQLFFGNEFTEYWYYPNTMYCKADIYF